MSLIFSRENFTLRPLRRDDGDTVLSWRNHPSIRQAMYTSHVITEEEHQRWLEQVFSQEPFASFIFEVSGEPMGFVGFSGLNTYNRRAQWTYHLRPESGRPPGMGAVMGYLALEQGFDKLGIRKLEGEVLAGNERSLRFHQQLRFRQEGFRQAHVFKDDRWCDVYEFSLLSDDWSAHRSALFDQIFSQDNMGRTRNYKPRLLFTGGGGAASQSLQEQWGQRYDLFFADANPHGFPPSIPMDRRLAIPFARDSLFADRLLELCDQHRIDLIVPGVDEELLRLAGKKGASGWPRILVPDVSFVSLMLDKLEAALALAAIRLDAPKTVPIERFKEISFPLIAKPRSGRGSRGVVLLKYPEQVAAYLTLQDGEVENYIAQELIIGDEYTVFVMADGGEAPCAVIPVRAFEKRGVTVRAQTEANAAIITYARAFQAHFRPSGCYNIQCMLTPDGRVFPFEVNPRISTTFVLAIATGYDPIPVALGESAGPTVIPQQKLTLQRSWHTHIAHQDEGTPHEQEAQDW
jgi:carbamoyl-phosphate synthase large subunit